MFRVCGTRISLSRGDTGLLTFEADGVTLTDSDRAVFTIRRRNGGIVMEKIAVPEDNRVQIPLLNAETEALCEDEYQWDIRYALGAVLDADGRVTDGREIITPLAPGIFRVEKVVGRI